MLKKLIILTICLVIGFFAFYYGHNKVKSYNKQDVVVIFEKGESLYGFVKELKDKGLILSTDLFKIQAILFNYDKKMKHGEYLLNTGMSSFDILNKISQGKVLYHKITIPEGLTIVEIKAMLNKNDKLMGDITIDIKEGYLLPETYTFKRGDTKNSILLQMKLAMEKNLNTIWKNRDIKIDSYIKSKEDLLKLASIVEKETIIDKEKPTVAKVYINRLKLNMRLQADPTVIYGAKNYQGDITYKMLRTKNDFNTYTIHGLPKTAIANPGIESLKAVANPDNSDYLYFVADGYGGHTFSYTYAEHKENVKKYLAKQKLKQEN